LTRHDAWAGTDEEKESACEIIEQVIDMASCYCDDSSTWLTAWHQNAAVLQAIWESQYDGSLESIDPDAPDSFDSDSGDDPGDEIYRERALCYAVRAMVDLVCAQALEQLNEKAAAVGIIGAIIGLIVGGGVGGFLFILATAFLISVGKAPFEDEQAREDVSCCIVTALQAVATSQANLESAANICYVNPLGGNPYAIAQAIRSSNAFDSGNFLAFVKTLAEGFRLAKLDLLEPCPCEVWEVDFYNGNGEPPLSLIDYDSGAYNAVEDRVDGENESITGPYDADVSRLFFNFSQGVLITNVTATMQSAAPNGPPFAVEISSVYRMEPTPVYLYDNTIGYGQHGDRIDNLDSGEIEDTVTRLRFTCQGGYPDGSPAGAYGRILAIHIAGIGYNPFEGV